MKKNSVKLIFVSVLAFSVQAHALSQETINIFNKKNRKLDPPRKSIRSDGSGYRLAANTTNETQSVQPMPEINEQAIYQERNTRRDTRVKDYSFTGDRTFGVGFVGAGAYGVFGVQFEFALGQDGAVGFGLGTGMSYSTWALNGRYFLKQGRLSTFLEGGYANWFLGKVSTSSSDLDSNYLVKRFLYVDGQPPTSSRRANIVYPGIGVLYQHMSGLAFEVQMQYMISLRDFSGGLFGHAGVFYYF